MMTLDEAKANAAKTAARLCEPVSIYKKSNGTYVASSESMPYIHAGIVHINGDFEPKYWYSIRPGEKEALGIVTGLLGIGAKIFLGLTASSSAHKL
jgi:hypothetical protein